MAVYPKMNPKMNLRIFKLAWELLSLMLSPYITLKPTPAQCRGVCNGLHIRDVLSVAILLKGSNEMKATA